MKQKWTVVYRNWVGTSKHGFRVERVRCGSGRWRYRYDDVPYHVRAFLTLKPMPMRGCSDMVMSSVRSETKLLKCAVSFPDRSTDRFFCEIDAPNPKRVKRERSYCPSTIRRALGSGYDSPWQLYRTYYKYTDCGPSLGMFVEGRDRAMYCDDLPGSWAIKGNPRITGFVVGSIVEGVDFDCQSIDVPCYPLKTLKDRLDAAVSSVNDEASYIWNQTHGCPKCNRTGEWGHPAINPKCKACKGEGVVI